VDALRRGGPATQRSFGPFTLDADRAELTRDGAPVPLRPKIHALLAYLVERAGSTVSKQELLDAVWPGLVVTDDSLTQAISELRAALGDREQKLIRTLPRRGYRLDVPADSRAPDVRPAPAPSPPSTRHEPRRWLVHVAATALGTGLVLLLLLGLAQLREAPAPLEASLSQARSIVVLPFVDLSDPPAPHVAHAIESDLATDLGRHTDLQVIVHAAAVSAGPVATDPRRAGREVGARHVLGGSVQRVGDAVSINVRLIRTASGEQIWSGRFDFASVADWSARRDISARLANLLDTQVSAAVLADTVRRRPSGAAVDHWMRGAHLLDRVQTRTELPGARDDLRRARVHFEAALAAEPDSARALAGLAITHVCEVLFRWSADRKASLAAAFALARRALAIDPNDMAALKALAGAQMFDGDLEGAMNTARRQLEINPSDAHSVRDLAATLYFFGRWDEALVQLERAERLNPLDPGHLEKVHSMASIALMALGRDGEALERARRLAAVAPHGSQAYLYLASANAHRGDIVAAREAGAELLLRRPGFMVGARGGTRGSTAPGYLAAMRRLDDGLRLAGLPSAPASAPR
jgi:DNA-binding winged helix-turn-helix (wHTH) protein/TolB-like protein